MAKEPTYYVTLSFVRIDDEGASSTEIGRTQLPLTDYEEARQIYKRAGIAIMSLSVGEMQGLLNQAGPAAAGFLKSLRSDREPGK